MKGYDNSLNKPINKKVYHCTEWVVTHLVSYCQRRNKIKVELDLPNDAMKYEIEKDGVNT